MSFFTPRSESGIYTVEQSGVGPDEAYRRPAAHNDDTRGPSAVSCRSERRVPAIDAIAVDVSSAHRVPRAEMADP
jgi:hypothetical protein